MHTQKQLAVIIAMLLVALACVSAAWFLPVKSAGALYESPRRQIAQALDQAVEAGRYSYRTTIAQTY